MSSAKSRVAAGMGTMYIVWGTTYLGIVYTVRTMPPELAMAFRFAMAAALLSLWVGFRQGWQQLRITKAQFGGAILIGAMLMGAGLGTMAPAERVLPVGVSALLVASMPIWIACFRLVSGNRPRPAVLLGVACGFFGLGVLLLPGNVERAPGATTGNVVLTMLIVLAGNLSWSLGSFLSPRIPKPPHPLVMSIYELVGGFLALSIVGLAMGERPADFLHASGESWLGWWYLVIPGSVLGYTVYVWLLDHAPISLVATYTYVNPVVSVILGILILHESTNFAMLVGGALALAGVVIVVTAESRDIPAAET